MRDDRGDGACACGGTIGKAVIAFVRDRDTRLNVRSDIERRFELRGVADVATRQMEVERIAAEIGFEVDLGPKAAARAPERLMALPPFAPAAETCARAVVLSKNCIRWPVRLHSASS